MAGIQSLKFYPAYTKNYTDAAYRSRPVEWLHAAQNAASPIKDYIKFYASPQSAKQFAETVVRAHKIATTEPAGPVFISVDKHLQEKSIEGDAPPIPKISPTLAPQGNMNALEQAAERLVNAENPVIVAERLARTPAGMDRLVELAELLQAPVLDRFGRMNFPNRHYLAQFTNSKKLLPEADVILGLEVDDLHGLVYSTPDTVTHKTRRFAREDVVLISIGTGNFSVRSNYQNFQRYIPVDLSIVGDGEATLPSLIELIKNKLTAAAKGRLLSREDKFRKLHKETRIVASRQAAIGWDASPVSVPRLCMEVWEQIKDLDWSRHTGMSGGWGIGYFAPAAVGVALANRDKGRFTVSIQSDGDLMYAPGILWTAAHHKIPLLYVMHNNRAYQQEIIHLQRVSVRRQRGMQGNAKIGNAIENPNIDFAQLANSLGLWSTGPIEKPENLADALNRAVEVVKSGRPALVDVVCQPR